jgi:COMPASS component BRE2
VSSPLNPDAAASRARKTAPREQREKKESLKKREAKGIDTVRDGTPDAQAQGRKGSKAQLAPPGSGPALIRYPIPIPKHDDFYPPGAPVLAPRVPALIIAGREFLEASEQ